MKRFTALLIVLLGVASSIPSEMTSALTDVNGRRLARECKHRNGLPTDRALTQEQQARVEICSTRSTPQYSRPTDRTRRIAGERMQTVRNVQGNYRLPTSKLTRRSIRSNLYSKELQRQQFYTGMPLARRIARVRRADAVRASQNRAVNAQFVRERGRVTPQRYSVTFGCKFKSKIARSICLSLRASNATGTPRLHSSN